MAKTRSVNTQFWKDGYIQELSKDERLLFIYLLTNPQTTIAGAYQISKKEMCFDTDIDLDSLSIALDRFEKDNKIIYRDGWIFIQNFIKHQSLNPKVLIGIREALKSCPSWICDRVKIAFDSLSIAFDAFNLNLNSNLKESKDSKKRETIVSPKKKQACSIPSDFAVTSEMSNWAKKNTPTVNLEFETENFKDHYTANGGKGLDWVAKWRTWMRNAYTQFGKFPNGKPQETPPPVKPPEKEDTRTWLEKQNENFAKMGLPLITELKPSGFKHEKPETYS